MHKLMIAILLIISAQAAAQKRMTDPVLDSLRNEKDSVVLQHKLQRLGNGTEKDLSTLINFYIYDGHKRDSIAKRAIQRFPKGDLAFRTAQLGLYKEDDPVERERLLIELQHAFPGRNMDQGYSAVSGAYAERKNLAKAKEYMNRISSPSLKSMVAGSNAREIMKYDAAAAAALLKPEIERLSKTGVPEEPRFRGDYLGMFNLYGSILVRENKYTQALPYVEVAYANTTRRDDQLSGDYGLVLSKNGRHQEALPLLEKLVNDGKADIEIKKAFAASYEQVNPGKIAKDYLAKADLTLKIDREAALSKAIMNEPSPDFAVKDINGNTVSLADFKGKIIVLDFWATWCGPCKKSFPFMQTVVNNYKNDPDVKFLFIHTRESAADPLTDAKNYLKENHYDFDLYMDTKDPKTNKNEAVTAFGAKGIPAKFLIDGKGIIRFKVIGFSGGDEPAVLELSSMIDLIKKNS